MTGNAFASSKDNLLRLASDIYGVRENSGRVKSDQKDSVNRVCE